MPSEPLPPSSEPSAPPPASESGHPPTPLWLTIVAVACASVSGAAIVLHVLGVPMYFVVDFLGPPSLVGLLVLGVYARRVRADVFFDRLIVGCWAGLVATLIYDVARYPIYASGLVHFNPFRSHPIFGELITGYDRKTWPAILVGWFYHFWNGFGFGVMYTVIAGRAWWVYAVIWALILEGAWLLALPSAVQLKLTWEALAVSLFGHGLYGVSLGLLSVRYIKK
jgi:hypothetical protein